MSLRRDIKIQRTARYFLSDEPSLHHKYLCFVLHGYGQLPEFFLRRFMGLKRQDILFVAPEGLHRHYLQGSKGRVGASWMTKEDRFNDIADYCQLLNQVAQEVLAEGSFDKTAILGFSQGVATACRWANNTDLDFQTLINWAGAFPPDLDFKSALENFKPKNLYMLCGDEDEFISEERLKEHMDFLFSQGFRPNLIRFKGGHDIEPKTLSKLLEEVFPIQK